MEVNASAVPVRFIMPRFRIALHNLRPNLNRTKLPMKTEAKTPRQRMIVQASYGSFTTVPTTIPTMTCPNGGIYPGTGCGPTQASNGNWASSTPVGLTSPPGFYQFTPTYGTADQAGTCNATTYDTDW